VTPVLSLDEAPGYSQHVANGHFVAVGGQWHPAPQPVLSRTPSRVTAPAPELGRDTADLLRELGYSAADVISFKQQGIAKVL
jgi:crotonobetainyl-CoA:carnitine CoA-transferase CaiB-like acyl-CoA transferase